MPSHLATLIELLHAIPRAALATHSTSLPGYPFASAVAFAPDESHRPVLLMSRLAEHSRNLQQDPLQRRLASPAAAADGVPRGT